MGIFCSVNQNFHSTAILRLNRHDALIHPQVVSMTTIVEKHGF